MCNRSVRFPLFVELGMSHWLEKSHVVAGEVEVGRQSFSRTAMNEEEEKKFSRRSHRP